jgi:peptidoglycan/LPS O-acetylase OafA/YrhL
VTDRRLTGFDWLRVIALALVVLRHVLQVTHLPLSRDVVILDQGQLGVALFCAMAGFFALGGDRPLGRWAADRVLRLFPAYWVVTAAVFAGNALIGYKPASTGLLVSQMLGLGYFTHGGDQLVNVPSWFLSLILACYVLAALVRVAPRRGPAILALAVVAATLTLADWRTDFVRQVLAFVAGMAIRDLGLLAAPAALRVAVVLALPGVAWLAPDLGYAAWAMAAVVAAAAVPLPALRPVRFLADHSYEIFLVHGPLLVLLVRLSGLPLVPALGLALVLSVVAAVGLARGTAAVVRLGPRGRPAVARPALAGSPRQDAA